jgi:putative ABC transport system substrate-binding protein
MHRRRAAYVYRILRGAKPASPPVERPSKFDLVVNTDSARVPGLPLPAAVILLADGVIQ